MEKEHVKQKSGQYKIVPYETFHTITNLRVRHRPAKAHDS